MSAFRPVYVGFPVLVVVLAFCYLPTYATATTTQLQNPANEPYFKKLPCPNWEDIFPCTCTYVDDQMDMHCAYIIIKDEKILYEIFHANIPYHNFTSLYLETMSLSTLNNDVFGEATFEVVYACPGARMGCGPIPLGTNLTSIGSETFIKSASTLRVLNLSFNAKLSSFPLESLELYTELRKLTLMGLPMSSFPIIQSATLVELYLGFAAYDTIPEGSLDGVPNLVSFAHSFTNITSMATGLFTSHPYIYSIDMPHSGFVHLERLQFEVNVRHSVTIELIGNQIAYIEGDSFKGVHADLISNSLIALNYNHLSILPEDTWRPVLDAGVELHLEGGNVLNCACDVAWLVLHPELYKDLLWGAKCNTNEKLWSLDPSKFEDC